MTPRRLWTLLALALVPTAAHAQNWLRSHDDSTYANLLLPREDGLLFEIGEDYDTSFDYLRTLDHDGELLAGVRLETLQGGFSRTLDAKLLPDGHVVVVGANVDPDAGTWVPWIGAIDPETGAADWHRLVGSDHFAYYDVEVGADAIYASGEWYDTSAAVLSKVDFDGNVLWTKTWSPKGELGNVFDICLMPTGGVAALYRDSDDYRHIVAFDAEGEVSWHRFYDTFGAQTLEVTEHGEIWVAGLDEDYEQVTVLALTASGQKLWQAEYFGYPSSVRAMLPTEDGGALLTVSRVVGETYRPSLLALDSTGAVQWSRMYELVDGDSLQIAQETVDVGERGLVLRWRGADRDRLLAVNPDGTAQLECVVTTELATLQLPSTIGPDEPPQLDVGTLVAIPEPWLLQPYAMTGSTELDCGNPCSVTASSFGTGLAGTGSIVPTLQGFDGACVGAPHPRLELTQGLGGTFGLLGFAAGASSLSIFGGTLYLDLSSILLEPIVLDGPVGVAGAGSMTLDLEVNLVNLMGITLPSQAFLYDPGAPQGWSFSEAVLLLID